MATYQYLDDRGSDGAILGYDSNAKVGFFGTTPADQPASANQAAAATTAITTAAVTTTTNSYGYATTTQANNITARVVSNTTLLNQIRTDLVELGIIKGSA
jgi:hypothetical protein